MSAVVFSTESKYDIKFGEYNDKKTLGEAIKKLKYHGRGTYTDLALKMLRTNVFNKANTRDGVPK